MLRSDRERDVKDNKRWKQIGRVLLLQAAAVASLVACGGGGGDDSSVPTQAPSTVVERPATITLTGYLVQRNQVVTVQGFASPTPEERASIFDHSRAHAVSMMQGLWVDTNAIVVPPLRESFVRTVASAARGETLVELRKQYSADLGFYAAMSQTRGIDRRVWAQRGAGFLPGFLAAIDSYGPLPPLGSWKGEEVGDWWSAEAASVHAELTKLHPGLPAAVPFSDANTRLIVADALHDAVSWPEAKRFDGIYLNDRGGRQILPMLRLIADVKRHVGSDFRADILRRDDRWLLAIQPRAGTLSDWLATGRRLDSALQESVQALTSPTLVALPAGEIVLPVVNLELYGQSASGTGLTLAFDEIKADLRGLDGGGTYLKTGDAKTMLQIGEAGLNMHAAQVSSFTFSQRNAFAPPSSTYGSVITMVSGPYLVWSFADACHQATADLRSFILVVLDEQKRVLSLAAIASLKGDQCY